MEVLKTILVSLSVIMFFLMMYSAYKVFLSIKALSRAGRGSFFSRTFPLMSLIFSRDKSGVEFVAAKENLLLALRNVIFSALGIAVVQLLFHFLYS